MKRTMKEVLKAGQKLVIIGLVIFAVLGLTSVTALMVHLGRIRYDVGSLLYFGVEMCIFIVCMTGMGILLFVYSRLASAYDMEKLREEWEEEMEALREDFSALEDNVIAGAIPPRNVDKEK